MKPDYQEKKQRYQYETTSNASPLFSELGVGFITAKDPMVALEKVVAAYKHPAGLFSAAILSGPKRAPYIAARYMSSRAATMEAAKKIERIDVSFAGAEWRADGYYTDGKKIPEQEEKYELMQST